MLWGARAPSWALTCEHVVVLIHIVQLQPFIQLVELVGVQHLALPVRIACVLGGQNSQGLGTQVTASPTAAAAQRPRTPRTPPEGLPHELTQGLNENTRAWCFGGCS